ncbi:hypothetical protein DID88_005882 [Monilinia fructigena]|uniref:Mob1/phocein n=1 Tax=Monilinia fructigena TaxID=38457 RepID=A0A395J126_9HELO|nr:hypothetical protein DID88_005882 [Monilinia fructigena]
MMSSALQPSSPRLPSPPPPTEIQIGPKSPSLGSVDPNQEQMIEQSIIETNASRRIRPGTKAADMAAGPPLIPLSELDSAFQLQEHLKALHYYHTKTPSKDHSIPITRETAVEIATPPNGLDQALWLYELCRFLINKYWATNIVTSQKIFPSRLSMAAGDAMDDRGAGVKHLINIFRRLHRIFAHAWFQHRGVFWQVEGQTGLYVLFKTVCDMHELLPPENYKLPPEAEGLENVEDKPPVVTSILKTPVGVEEDFLGLGRQNTTRRHVRQSPSVGSAITTVQEIDEDDGEITQRLRIARNLRIAEEEGEDGEVESDTGTEIPVIVETFEEVDPDHDMEPVESNNGVVGEEEPNSETREELEPEQEDRKTVIHDEPKANSTDSWDSMSSDLVGDKMEAAKENGDVEEEKAEAIVEDPVTEPLVSENGEETEKKSKEHKEQKDNSSEDETIAPPKEVYPTKESPTKKSKKSKKKAKKSAAAKEAPKIASVTNHTNDDTKTTEKETGKPLDQNKEKETDAEEEKA